MAIHVDPIPIERPTDSSVMDCPSLTISYAANGLATVNFTIYMYPGTGFPYTSNGPGFTMQVSDVGLKGYVTEQTVSPASEVLWDEYKVTAICVGKR